MSAIIVITFIALSPLILGTIFMGAQKRINVKHQESGITRQCFVGYCLLYKNAMTNWKIPRVITEKIK
jgi:hypothetical protein